MGIRAMHTAATGMNGQLKLIDVIANNLANVNTSGFRRDRLHFADLFYQQMQIVGAPSSGDRVRPVGYQIGHGVRPVATEKEFEAGGLENTGNEYHMAIAGDGNLFFRVSNGEQVGYTRSGNFTRNEDGQIVTLTNWTLEPPITVPQEIKKLSVHPDGTIGYLDYQNREIQELGQITLTRFTNPAGLREEGDNLFFATDASGAPQEVIAGQGGNTRIQQGFLEQSNVSAISELIKMIQAQRSYEMNSNVIKTSDEALQVVNNLR